MVKLVVFLVTGQETSQPEDARMHLMCPVQGSLHEAAFYGEVMESRKRWHTFGGQISACIYISIYKHICIYYICYAYISHLCSLYTHTHCITDLCCIFGYENSIRWLWCGVICSMELCGTLIRWSSVRFNRDMSEAERTVSSDQPGRFDLPTGLRRRYSQVIRPQEGAVDVWGGREGFGQTRLRFAHFAPCFELLLGRNQAMTRGGPT